ncbi:hypothetical protein ACLMJK_003440 [Lecanora helva]
MASSPIRIAILEADIPIGSIRTKYGSYGGVFTSFLHKACDASHISRDRLHITGWDVVNSENAPEGQEEDMGGENKCKRRKGYPALDEVDGVLITGSRFNAFDNDPWVIKLVEYTQQILGQDRVKIIGCCYGHQILGRALGAKVARSESGAWEVSVCQVNQTPKGKELFGGKDVLSIFQMHKDLVYHYPSSPSSLEPLGSSDACKVQGMYIPERALSVQGHPEFTEEIVRELLGYRRAQGIFDDRIYEEAMSRVGDNQDGVMVGQAFLRFLGL